MRQVSIEAAKVLDILTGDITTENHYKKINNTEGTYMPVSIQLIESMKWADLVSVAHYYEQNGDLMADPEIVYLRRKAQLNECTTKFVYWPVAYRQDGLGINRELVEFENEQLKSYKPRAQRDTAMFSTVWMKNIKQQQKL